MVFITGPLYSGKRTFANHLGLKYIAEVQDLAEACKDEQELTQLAEKLSTHEAVIATEVGGGIVPVDPQQRRARENAGRLSCLLAQRAETVVRVYCGIPTVLKGTLK